MKRIKLLLIMSLFSAIHLTALPLSEARREALFLTDKMAYELNLSPYQYEHVYRVNLEYFLNVSTYRDCFGSYYEYRNTDLSYILTDWQYSLYRSISYFFTPIKWLNASWHFDIYRHYKKAHYYFHKPSCYATYHGGKWKHRHTHTPSIYREHKFEHHKGMCHTHYKRDFEYNKNKSSYQCTEIGRGKTRPSSINRINAIQTKTDASSRISHTTRTKASKSKRNPNRENTLKKPTSPQISRENLKRHF